ncbi:heterokaryon incompatibility protein-domain-containing protein [Halenospora varia]|nr:heterokaryon incompatibility protein-domain-containing protein [Halenospora varia]
MQEFTYTPLGFAQSTRLIKILPGESISSIKCHIFEINLQDLPISGYTALSYCWGSASKTEPITLNHYPFRVTKNLYAALQILRESHSTDLFWIDAMCVNQSDPEERSAQVQKMKKIYEQASRVVIWLGPGSAETMVAMRFIEKIRGIWNSLAAVHGNDKTALLDITVKEASILFDSREGVVDFKPLEGLALLLRRPWFERVWIVQEATTPENDKIVLCGNAVVCWDALITTTEVITHLMWRPGLQGLFANVQSIDNQSLRRLFNLEKQRQYKTPVFNLLQILAKYRHFKAGDPRDKIYALRGLAADLLEDELVPNYSLPPPAVFALAAQHFIISKRSFECLGFCDFSKRDLRQPSWVPDWSSPSIRHPLAKRQIHDSCGEGHRVYGAATLNVLSDNERQWNCTIKDGLVLTVAGFQVDTVSRVVNFDVLDACVADDGYSIAHSFNSKFRKEWGSLLFSTTKRSLFWSHDGYLGLGPTDVKPGDRVCIFFGGEVLYLLRFIRETSHFIGECYVHGLMDGEAYALLDDGSHTVETFVIE